MSFSAPYSEVKKFQLNAAVVDGIGILGETEDKSIQYVADNVDQNIATLDGHGTFHGMEIIITVTPGTKQTKAIPRVNVDLKVVLDVGRISIHLYNPEWNGLSSSQYEKLPQIFATDFSAPLDFLWKISLPLETP